jgi:hypothetical protein
LQLANPATARIPNPGEQPRARTPTSPSGGERRLAFIKVFHFPFLHTDVVIRNDGEGWRQ